MRSRALRPLTTNSKPWTITRFKSRPATQLEVDEARKAFENPAMRSCWECNRAHTHFLRDGDDFSFVCFGCGRLYHGGVDITDYRDTAQSFHSHLIRPA